MPVTIPVYCQDEDHRVRLEDDGDVVLLDHEDVDSEVALAALGADTLPCLSFHKEWSQTPFAALRHLEFPLWGPLPWAGQKIDDISCVVAISLGARALELFGREYPDQTRPRAGLETAAKALAAYWAHDGDQLATHQPELYKLATNTAVITPRPSLDPQIRRLLIVSLAAVQMVFARINGAEKISDPGGTLPPHFSFPQAASWSSMQALVARGDVGDPKRTSELAFQQRSLVEILSASDSREALHHVMRMIG